MYRSQDKGETGKSVVIFFFKKRLLHPRLGPRGPPPGAQVVRVLLLVDLDGGERGLVAHGFDGGGGEGEQREELGARGADGGVEGDVLRGC